MCQGTQIGRKESNYCICLDGQIGTNENNRTKIVFDATNKDYVGGEIDYTTSVNVT